MSAARQKRLALVAGVLFLVLAAAFAWAGAIQEDAWPLFVLAGLNAAAGAFFLLQARRAASANRV